MKQRLNVITLGVDDLEKAVAFYRDGLGLPTPGIVGTEFPDGAVAFFKMNGDSLILALWPRASLARESGIALTPRSASELALGYNVNSKAEVDAMMAEVERAGAMVTQSARDRAWGGYSGVFQDPDGHVWEVVWNPQLTVPEE